MRVSELFEGRIKGATYTTKEVKGKVEKVIAELKGAHSAAWTKISKQYVELDTEIKKLEEQRAELNAELKAKATGVFDTEDEVLTRVVETSQLVLTLSKKVKTEAHPEVDGDAVVKALAEADLPKELRKMVSAIIKANTKITPAKETPERLTVKVNKVEESIGSTLTAIISAVKSWLKAFDSKYTKIAEMVKMLKVPVAEAVKRGWQPGSFPDFGSWLLQKHIVDEDDLDDAIDNAYVRDTEELELAQEIMRSIGKKDIKDVQAKALKMIESHANFCITGDNKEVNAKIKKVVPKYAAEVLRHLTKHWKDIKYLLED
jgi:chromosome segregation ATPase